VTDDRPAARRLPRNVKVLAWASLLNDIAGEMVYPLLPDFLIHVLGGNKTWLGVIDGTAESVSSLVKLWSGSRSDRGGGHKWFVVVGYALAALTRPFAAIITLPWQLFGIRVSDRIGKGIRTPPRDALIANSTPPEVRGWAFGFRQSMDHIGAAVGPLLAAAYLWFRPTGLRELFLLTLVPGLLVVLLLWFGLRAPKIAKTAATSGERHTWTLRPFDRSFRLYLLALVVFTLGNSSDLFLLTRAKELGVYVWQLPLLWCAFGALKSVGNMFSGRAVDRVGPRPMILLGWLLYAAIYLAFALASAAWQVWVLFFAYAIFYAMTEPAEKTLVANLVGPERRGLAYGWYDTAIGVATLPASVLFGGLYDHFGAMAAFGSGAGLALLAAVLLWRLCRT
jgi:MFS family permease